MYIFIYIEYIYKQIWAYKGKINEKAQSTPPCFPGSRDTI